MRLAFPLCCFFFFNDTATTEIYTLSLHDALPISAGADVLEAAAAGGRAEADAAVVVGGAVDLQINAAGADRKSTRLNSSHLVISYAVFCLKKKKKKTVTDREDKRREKQRIATQIH